MLQHCISYRVPKCGLCSRTGRWRLGPLVTFVVCWACTQGFKVPVYLFPKGQQHWEEYWKNYEETNSLLNAGQGWKCWASLEDRTCRAPLICKMPGYSSACPGSAVEAVPSTEEHWYLLAPVLEHTLRAQLALLSRELQTQAQRTAIWLQEQREQEQGIC